MARRKHTVQRSGKKQPKTKKSTVICINKDCKLRKQKSCKGFEACPGFQGK